MVPLTGSVVYFAYRHRKELKAEGVSPLKYALPLLAAAAIQIFVYGYPLLNIALVMTAILIFADIIRKEAAAARARELTIVNQKNMLRDLRTRIAVSQIKPHFLFNVLNTIYVLCDLDVKKGREAISDLTDYLRTNIGSIDSDEPILFSEEMHYVEAYLKLEKLRFPDVIHVEYDLRDEEFRIPALSIQPLVENAVRHGIRKRKGGGTILIRAVREGDFHVITVHDNGAGFTPEEIPKDDPNHIGIRNVRERLELISGAKMNINSVPGNGTTVTIRVPACTA